MANRRTVLTAVIALMCATFGIAALAQAIVSHLDQKVNFDGFTVFVPCANGGAGEDVVFLGTLHILETATINGNKVRLKFHFQPQGLQGIGTVTGDKYNATGVTQETDNIATVGAETTFVNNFRMVGQGPGNNFSVHQVFHITVNANGDITSVVDQFTTDCK